jgi:dethiobiotin synthetase
VPGKAAQGVFVTGTDTGVGKTMIACALLRAFAAAGKSAVGMKPVAAGLSGGRSADVESLRQASTARAPAKLANPYSFEPAIAPHIAARLAGVEIDIEKIGQAFGELARSADVVVVEGVGGFLVPLNARQTGADLAQRLGLPVLLVVGMRLGCLNHALLTRRVIDAHGLHCAGWVANCITPDMDRAKENIEALDERLACPRLGVVPFQRDVSPESVARHLVIGSLLTGTA